MGLTERQHKIAWGIPGKFTNPSSGHLVGTRLGHRRQHRVALVALQLGHVAAVSRVLDSRRILLDHANWSPINGRRGQIEKDVLAVDVSPANDWSQVRVWYAPLGKVGTTAWPVEGFIYSNRPAQEPRRQLALAPARKETSRRFLSAFAAYAD